MNNKRMTYKSALSSILNNEPMTDEVRETLERLLTSLEKKSSGKRKPTAQQTENATFRQLIIDFLSSNPDNKYTIGEMIKSIPAFADYADDEGKGMSSNRVSALTTQLCNAKVIQRIIDKRKTYFQIV